MAWPILLSAVADFTAGPPNLPGINAVALNPTVDVKAFDTSRGRQYELDTAEAGTLNLTIDDPNEALSPLNSGSPWNAGSNSLLPYRGVQLGAYWNPAPPLNANTTFEGGLSPWTASGGTATQSPWAHSGAYSCQFAPDGVSSQGQINSETIAITPGVSYQFSAWVWLTAAVTGDASVSVNWYTSGLSYLSSGTNYVSVNAQTWTRLSATYAAPTTAAYGQIVVAVAGTQILSNVWYVDDVYMAPQVGNLAGNLLNASNWAPGQPWLGAIYGYDPSFETWAIQTAQSTGGTSVVTGLPTAALNSNTGFETAISPWVAAGCTAVQSSTQKHSGSFSAKLTPNGTAAASQMFSELIDVVPGRQYTLTAWMWVTSAITSNATIAVSWYDSGDTFLSASVSTAASIPATTWTQVTTTVTAPAGATIGQMLVQVAGTPPSSNILYFDDISMTNLSVPADGTAPVTVVSFASSSDRAHWTPRFVPGQSYTFTVDINAPSGLVVTVGWYGVTTATTSITGNGAYQTATLNFTTAAGDSAAPISYLYVQAGSAGSYPQTIYVASYKVSGQSPAWTLTSGAAQQYTQAQAEAGLYSMALTLNSASDSASLIMPTVPGQQYTLSAYVYIQNTGSGLTATQTIGSNTQTLSTASTWTRLSNTFTATAATTSVVWKGTTSAYPAKIYVDCVQLELAATASTFTRSGPVFKPIYTGWIERYPQQWSTMGRRGMRPLTGVDAISVLSRITPETNYKSVILADNPSAYMPLNDKALPQVVELPQGGFSAQGYTSLGTSGQVSFGGDTFLDGTSCVSVSQQNANPPTSGNAAYVTYLGTSNLSVPMNPQAFTVEFWYRVTSGTAYFGVAAVEPGENPNGEALGPNQWIGWYTEAGKLAGIYNDASGSHFNSGLPGTSGYPDGNWHYQAIVLPGSSGFHFWGDGVGGGVGTMSGTPFALALNNFFIDATTYFGDLSTVISVANVATYNYALTDTQLSNHYQRGIGHLGETDMARCLRMLDQYWSPATLIGTPQATLSADFYYFTVTTATITTSASTPPSLLQDLQDITNTGSGFLWADAYGIVHVDSRETRYTQAQSATAQFVFSDNPTDIAGGALPYEDLAYDYDPTYVYSEAQLSCDGTGDVVTVTNSTSVTNYNQRILSQTMYFPDDWQTLQAANFLTGRYAAPAGAPGSSIPYRITKLTINPAANPALWQAVLTLDVDYRITVTKKTAAGTIITGDYYIEQVKHRADVATAQWKVDYQLSPVWNPTPFIVGQSLLGSGATYVY